MEATWVSCPQIKKKLNEEKSVFRGDFLFFWNFFILELYSSAKINLATGDFRVDLSWSLVRLNDCKS